MVTMDSQRPQERGGQRVVIDRRGWRRGVDVLVPGLSLTQAPGI